MSKVYSPSSNYATHLVFLLAKAQFVPAFSIHLGNGIAFEGDDVGADAIKKPAIRE